MFNWFFDFIRIFFWDLAMAGILGFAGNVYEVILFLPNLLMQIMSNDFVQNMVRNFGILSGGIASIMLLVVVIRTMGGAEDALANVKKMLISLIIFACFPMIFNIGLNLTNAAINDVDNLVSGSGNITFIEEIANGWWHVNEDLTESQKQEVNQATNNGNPFGTENCSLLSCKKLLFRPSGKDKYGDKDTYGLSEENLIVGLLFSFALIFLLFLAGVKIIGYIGKLILYNVFGPLFAVLGTNGLTSDYMKNYFVKLTQTFIALFVQVLSISFSSLLIGVMINILGNAGLSPSQYLIGLIICIIGGLMIMIGGSDFFVDMFSTDTGVESVLNTYIGGKSVGAALGGIKGVAGGTAGLIKDNGTAMGDGIKEGLKNDNTLGGEFESINPNDNDTDFNNSNISKSNDNKNDVVDNDSISINDDFNQSNNNLDNNFNDDNEMSSSITDNINSADGSISSNINETNTAGNISEADTSGNINEINTPVLSSDKNSSVNNSHSEVKEPSNQSSKANISEEKRDKKSSTKNFNPYDKNNFEKQKPKPGFSKKLSYRVGSKIGDTKFTKVSANKYSKVKSKIKREKGDENE